MEDEAHKSKDGSDAPSRRRGRPAGKNRVPLSLKERRARNAQYERERRYETSEAMAELTAAVGCNPTLSSSNILATAISQIQRGASLNTSREVQELKDFNMKLTQQIETLEQRLINLEKNRISPKNNNKQSIKGKGKNKQ